MRKRNWLAALALLLVVASHSEAGPSRLTPEQNRRQFEQQKLIETPFNGPPNRLITRAAGTWLEVYSDPRITEASVRRLVADISGVNTMVRGHLFLPPRVRVCFYDHGTQENFAIGGEDPLAMHVVRRLRSSVSSVTESGTRGIRLHEYFHNLFHFASGRLSPPYAAHLQRQRDIWSLTYKLKAYDEDHDPVGIRLSRELARLERHNDGYVRYSGLFDEIFADAGPVLYLDDPQAISRPLATAFPWLRTSTRDFATSRVIADDQVPEDDYHDMGAAVRRSLWRAHRRASKPSHRSLMLRALLETSLAELSQLDAAMQLSPNPVDAFTVRSFHDRLIRQLRRYPVFARTGTRVFSRNR